MRRLAFILALVATMPAAAQDVIRDTLDWRGYYPLQVGNVWEWDVWELVAAYRIERRDIVGDTLIQGVRYFIQIDEDWETDEGKSFFRLLQRQTTFVRHDTLATRVVYFDPELSSEADYTCDLAALSGAEIVCHGLTVGVSVGGPFEVAVGSDRLTFPAAKGYAAHGIGWGYIHGFGEQNVLGDGTAGTIDVGHLILDGQEYGASVIEQDLKVIRSTPADGDSAVALNTTVSFDFTLPLDTTARFSRDLPVEFFAISPPDSIQIDSVYYNSNLTTMYLDVRHTDDTDFYWHITGARSEMDTLFCRPYALAYTTADSRGIRSVSGTAHPAWLVKQQPCGVSALAAVLYSGFPESSGYPVAGAVASEAGGYSFSIEGVRKDIYWPAAIADLDDNGRIGGGVLPEIVWYQESGPPGTSIDTRDSDVTNVHLIVLAGGAREGDPVAPVRSLAMYPNPATSEVTLRFEALRPGNVVLEVIDLLGRKVWTLADGFYYSGRHELTLDASSLPAGVYFVRFRAGDRVETRSLVVAR